MGAYGTYIVTGLDVKSPRISDIRNMAARRARR
jgi:hypothetical protein